MKHWMFYLLIAAPLLATAKEGLRPFPVKVLLDYISSQEAAVKWRLSQVSPFSKKHVFQNEKIQWEPELLPLASMSWLYFNVPRKYLNSEELNEAFRTLESKKPSLAR